MLISVLHFLKLPPSQQFLLAGSQKSRESWGVGDWEHRIIFISLPHPPSFWPHGKMFYCRTSRLSCTYKFFTAQLTWHLYLSCPTAGRVWQLMIWKRKGTFVSKLWKLEVWAPGVGMVGLWWPCSRLVGGSCVTRWEDRKLTPWPLLRALMHSRRRHPHDLMTPYRPHLHVHHTGDEFYGWHEHVPHSTWFCVQAIYKHNKKKNNTSKC